MTTKELAGLVESLQQQVAVMQAILKAFGLPITAWISIADAARISNVSRTTVSSKIDLALSINGGADFIGSHFRDISAVESSQVSWQVNVFKLNELIGLSKKLG